jgi:hypothetical protein
MDIIREKQYGKEFEEIYGASIYKAYESVIDFFFTRERPVTTDKPLLWKRPDGVMVDLGFIWVANHGAFETLTVEPMDGNQYEIAVRMPHPSDRTSDTDRYFWKYSGYSINQHGTLNGFDTNGH